MKKLETISSKISELSKELWQLMRDIPPCCIERLNEISKICELQNKVAALSNSRIADALMDTIKHIAYAKAEPNYETCCIYLEEAIKDLMSGMDAVDMLCKYDMILYNLQHRDELEKNNMFLKEIRWHEQCVKNKGDKCEYGRCQYSVLTLGQEDGFYCGRESIER